MLEVLISLVIFGGGVVAAEGQTGKAEFSIERVGHAQFCRDTEKWGGTDKPAPTCHRWSARHDSD
jgi:hypothetical protein